MWLLLLLLSAAHGVRVGGVGMSALTTGATGITQYHYRTIEVATGTHEADAPVPSLPTQEISLHDITPAVREFIAETGVRQGTLNLISRHTTTAITINEMETRLVDDVRDWLFNLAPQDHPYRHNDLHMRPASGADRDRIDKNWMSQGKGTLEEFMAQEPINAHSHLMAMLLGASEAVPICDGELCIGQWQSLILVDLDGPRNRTVGVQVVGMH